MKVIGMKYSLCTVYRYNDREAGMEERIANIVFILTLVSAICMTIIAL